jgi:hypothetical protein
MGIPWVHYFDLGGGVVSALGRGFSLLAHFESESGLFRPVLQGALNLGGTPSEWQAKYVLPQNLGSVLV